MKSNLKSLHFLDLMNNFSQFLNLLNEYVSLRYVWMTNKDFWNGNEKKMLCYLNLNSHKSSEYLESNTFKMYIKSRVKNTKYQLSLNLGKS